MRVTILGSGSIFIDKDHSAPAYLIETGEKNILFDCGPGTLNQLAKIDFDPLKIDYIFLSHFHIDHTSDLLAILIRPYLLEKVYGGKFEKVLKVVGPVGVEGFAKKIGEICHHDFLHKYQKIEFTEFSPKMKFEGFEVEVFPVSHLGLDANALRLSAEGKVFAYTGDAELSEGVANAAKNADLLIADAAIPKGLRANAHMSTTQVGQICRDNNVKKVILSHQSPPGYDIDMVGDAKEVYDGEVVLAKDLMSIEI